jgi:hypothetical protein
MIKFSLFSIKQQSPDGLLVRFQKWRRKPNLSPAYHSLSLGYASPNSHSGASGERLIPTPADKIRLAPISGGRTKDGRRMDEGSAKDGRRIIEG